MGDSLFRIPFWLNRQRLLPQHHLVVTQFLRSQAFLVLFSVTRSEKNRYLLAHEIEWCHYIQWRYVRLCCDFSQQGLDPHQRNRDHCSRLDWQHNSQIGRLRFLEVHAQLSGTSSELWHRCSDDIWSFWRIELNVTSIYHVLYFIFQGPTVICVMSWTV